jgi:hypothetical protein
MATKSGLTSAISTALSVVITKAKVLLSLNNLVNEVYPNIITEAYTNLVTTTTNTTPIGTTHHYTTYWIKQGRKVSVFGNISNKTGASTSNEDYITINIGEFTPQANINDFIAHSTSDNRNIRCRISGNNIQVRSALANNETISFQFSYNAKD